MKPDKNSNFIRIMFFGLFAYLIFSPQICEVKLISIANVKSDLPKDQKSPKGETRNTVTKEAMKVLNGTNHPYILLVEKSNFTLKVIRADGKVIKVSPVAIGKNKDGRAKLYQGDGRTPEGIYKITEILSLDAPQNSRSYKKLLSMNSAYFKASEGHHKWGQPDVDIGRNAYGPRFFRINYPNQADLNRYKEAKKKGLIPKKKHRYVGIGGGLAIHGYKDELSIGHKVSRGCIMLKNKDIIQLDKYIKIGTPVMIVN